MRNDEQDLDRIEGEIDELGYAFVPGIVSAEEIAELRSQLEQAIIDDMDEFGDLEGKQEYMIVDMLRRGNAFVRLLENDAMHRVFGRILGQTCVLYAYASMFLRPGEEPPATKMHIDTHRFISNYHTGILMTLALDDFTAENGATRILPRSHKSERVPSKEEFLKNSVCAERKAGDVVFLSNRIFHSAMINRTEETRYGVAVYACRSFMKQRLDYPRLVTPEILSQLGEKGRAFLGFNVRVPTSCEEFYLPENERLYKPGQG